MSKGTIAPTNINQIQSLINRLNIEQKIKLVENLEKNTWQYRFKKLLNRIDKNLEKYPISEEEITHTVEETRQEIYDKRRNRH